MKELMSFVRVDGSLLRASVRGEGTPLLLVMGIGGNIEMWRPLEDALNARGFQTIAYDAPGTGDSPARAIPRRMPGLARQAAHLLDALGYPCVDVLGVSFGGAVAQELALHNPHRIRHLILASTTCGLGGIPGNPLAVSILASPLRYYSPRFMRTVAPIVYGRSGADGKFLEDQINARRSRPPTVWGYAAQLAAISGWSSLPWLHRISAPTLVLSGGADPIIPPLNARILARRIPSSRLEIVAGEGHLLVLNQAERCAEMIADFTGAEAARAG